MAAAEVTGTALHRHHHSFVCGMTNCHPQSSTVIHPSRSYVGFSMPLRPSLLFLAHKMVATKGIQPHPGAHLCCIWTCTRMTASEASFKYFDLSKEGRAVVGGGPLEQCPSLTEQYLSHRTIPLSPNNTPLTKQYPSHRIIPPSYQQYPSHRTTSGAWLCDLQRILGC